MNRLGCSEDRLSDHQHRPMRRPGPGERLYPAENQPAQQQQEIEVQDVRQDNLYYRHDLVLLSRRRGDLRERRFAPALPLVA